MMNYLKRTSSRNVKQYDKKSMKAISGDDKRLRVIIDTNLWISFLIGRRLDILLEMFEDPWFELVCTPLLREEIITVAEREKFRKWFSLEKVELLKQFIDNEMTMIEIDLKHIPVRCRDPKDDYLLELAVKAQAIYLVTGDDDLLSIGNIGECCIMTVHQFEQEWKNKTD